MLNTDLDTLVADSPLATEVAFMARQGFAASMAVLLALASIASGHPRVSHLAETPTGLRTEFLNKKRPCQLKYQSLELSAL
jgi:hypothetical protein